MTLLSSFQENGCVIQLVPISGLHTMTFLRTILWSCGPASGTHGLFPAAPWDYRDGNSRVSREGSDCRRNGGLTLHQQRPRERLMLHRACTAALARLDVSGFFTSREGVYG